MKTNVKRGFTIKELVLIIAICAIASAIIIPIGVSIVLSVEDANDGAIVVTKELNAAIEEAQPDTLNEALDITKKAGFRADRINTRRSKALLVFDTDSKQFMLVERDTYNVIYNAKDYKADDAKASWWFPVSDLRHAMNITNAGYNAMHVVSNVDELDYVLRYAPSNEKVTVYLDSDFGVSGDNVLNLFKRDASVTIDLVDQALSLISSLDDVAFSVNGGQLTVKNGVINAHGNNPDGGSGIRAEDDSVLNIFDTKINITADNGYVDFAGGDGMLSNVSVNSAFVGFGAIDGSQVILENCYVVGKNAAIISSTYDDETRDFNEKNVTNVFIKSGTYTANETSEIDMATVVSFGGNIVISGGTFRNVSDDANAKLFASYGGSITITDGSFICGAENAVRKSFSQMTEADWLEVADGSVSFEKNGDAIVKVIITTIESRN